MEYRNPIHTADGRIDCEINHPEFGWIPFTADKNDTEQHCRALFEEISKNGSIAAYVPPPTPPTELLAEQARLKRNELLAGSDWTDTLSAKTRMGDALYDAWQNYRQELRDVPQQLGFPTNNIWPTKPE